MNGGSLHSGNTQSCGCILKETPGRLNHGHAAHYTVSATYRIWKHICNKCTNPSRRDRRYYGGAGIQVCDRWHGKHGFEHFLTDMHERPAGTMLSRNGGAGNYEPGNCAWRTPPQNGAEHRKTN
jgi:hypothetical protein